MSMRSKHKNEIDHIFQEMKQADEQISNLLTKYQSYTRVILLGRTGVAKSSISNLIIGEKLKVKKTKLGFIKLSSNKSKFKMGDSMISQTTLPNIYLDDAHNLLICDAPGFSDNRGSEQEIINAFSIDKLFTNPCQIKIVFVLSEKDVAKDGRGKEAMENLHRILQILPDEKILEDNMCLILSKIDQNRKPEKYLEELIDGNADQELIKWMKHYIDHSQEKLFSFPSATYNQIGSPYIFYDLPRLLDFLYQTPVVNPPHRVVLCENSQSKIREITDKYCKIDDSVKDLITKLNQMYNNDSVSIDDLNKWNQSFSNIVQNKINIKTPQDLVNTIITNIKSLLPIGECLKQIQSYQSFFVFMLSIEDFIKLEELTCFGERVCHLFQEELIKIQQKIKINTINENTKKCQSDKERMATEAYNSKIKLLEDNKNIDNLQNQANGLSLEVADIHNQNASKSNSVYSLEVTVQQKENELNNKKNLVNSLKNAKDNITQMTNEKKGQLNNALYNADETYESQIRDMENKIEDQRFSNRWGLLSNVLRPFK